MIDATADWPVFSAHELPCAATAQRRIQAGDGHPLIIWAQELGHDPCALMTAAGISPAEQKRMIHSTDFYPDTPRLLALCRGMKVHPCDLMPINARVCPTPILQTLITLIKDGDIYISTPDAVRARLAIAQEWDRFEQIKNDPARARDYAMFMRANLLFYNARQAGQSRDYAAQEGGSDSPSLMAQLSIDDPWRHLDARALMGAEDRLMLLFHDRMAARDSREAHHTRTEHAQKSQRRDLLSIMQALWGFKMQQAVEAMDSLRSECLSANPRRDVVAELRTALTDRSGTPRIPDFYNGGDGLAAGPDGPLRTRADRLEFFLKAYAKASTGHTALHKARQDFQKASDDFQDVRDWFDQMRGHDNLLTLYRNRCLIVDSGLQGTAHPPLLPHFAPEGNGSGP